MINNDRGLYHFIAIVILLLLGILAVTLCGGCQDGVGLRFAPSEVIKQNAELSHLLALKINEDGTDAESPASEQLVTGTGASLTYTGRPKVAPNLGDFETVNKQAQTDAELRPDVGKLMDSGLEIGLGIAALISGAGGIKLAQGLRKVHGKAKAFNEVVSQNDLFKKVASADEFEKFKRILAHQTPKTQQLVAQARISDKTQMVSVPKGTVQ